MKKAILGMAALGVGIALTASSPADARQGCGRGYHRGPYGHCVMNGRHEVLVVDQFYPGRGYWDGHRYWWHRERLHGRWRYR